MSDDGRPMDRRERRFVLAVMIAAAMPWIGLIWFLAR